MAMAKSKSLRNGMKNLLDKSSVFMLINPIYRVAEESKLSRKVIVNKISSGNSCNIIFMVQYQYLHVSQSPFSSVS